MFIKSSRNLSFSLRWSNAIESSLLRAVSSAIRYPWQMTCGWMPALTSCSAFRRSSAASTTTDVVPSPHCWSWVLDMSTKIFAAGLSTQTDRRIVAPSLVIVAEENLASGPGMGWRILSIPLGPSVDFTRSPMAYAPMKDCNRAFSPLSSEALAFMTWGIFEVCMAQTMIGLQPFKCSPVLRCPPASHNRRSWASFHFTNAYPGVSSGIFPWRFKAICSSHHGHKMLASLNRGTWYCCSARWLTMIRKAIEPKSHRVKYDLWTTRYSPIPTPPKVGLDRRNPRSGRDVDSAIAGRDTLIAAVRARDRNMANTGNDARRSDEWIQNS
mmetsp:Transcript_29694/g.76163  ORF Transcript_29694/g.76163 Transcript_29694/m.76163 type:complete len:326 (+) Transcript_29694:1297-2274(+)